MPKLVFGSITNSYFYQYEVIFKKAMETWNSNVSLGPVG